MKTIPISKIIKKAKRVTNNFNNFSTGLLSYDMLDKSSEYTKQFQTFKFQDNYFVVEKESKIIRIYLEKPTPIYEFWASPEGKIIYSTTIK